MTTESRSAAIRRQIATDAATPAGYFAGQVRTDNIQRLASAICAREVKSGRLFEARFSPAVIRYFATQVAADAALAGPKPLMRHTPPAPSPQRATINELILRRAALPGGFATADARGVAAPTMVARALAPLKRRGRVFASSANGSRSRYFTTQAAADAFDVARQEVAAAKAASKAAKAAMPVKAKAPKLPKAAKAKTPKAPKPPKAPKAVKPPKPKPAPVGRPPIVRAAVTMRPPAPVKRADTRTIIWPEHIKPVCRMMPPDRYAAVVPYRRIGEPGFAMQVGGVA